MSEVSKYFSGSLFINVTMLYLPEANYIEAIFIRQATGSYELHSFQSLYFIQTAFSS